MIRRIFFLLALSVGICNGDTVLLEAESFDDIGGWVIDQQVMDQMGSPYLLAHGLGKPVENAVAEVVFPQGGSYDVYVRTRDWTAPWFVSESPGRFSLIVNKSELDETFGTQGAEWGWQKAGPVKISKGVSVVELKDLTGFDGRCDAIIFTTDRNIDLPASGDELSEFRSRHLGLSDNEIDEGSFDFVVVGGGMGGTCAAISAARCGLKTALIQNRPVLGGNNSSEVRVHLQGRINLPPYPQLGNLVRELDSGYQGNAMPAFHYDDDRKLTIARNQENLSLFVNMHVYKVEKKGDRIVSVTARHIRKNTNHVFKGKLFSDCTGDGNLGYLAGADFRMGRESKSQTGETLAPAQPDKMTMGTSVQWYALETDEPVSFPECTWAVKFSDETCHPKARGEWDWETGMNKNQISEFEYIRDYGLRVAFGNWSYLKNHYKFKQDFKNHELSWVAYIGGKRESRRLLGDVILQQQDIEEYRRFEDAFVTTTWTIDLHYPHPDNSRHFPGAEFRSVAKHQRIKPYPIPYRCLYSRNVSNLFMAGRNISVTHVALGTVRVMRTIGMMGELVGMAASVAIKQRTDPRGVYEDHLDELKALAKKGVGINKYTESGTPPKWLEKAGENLALSAKVSVSDFLDPVKYPAGNINDGKINTKNNDVRWVSSRQDKNHWVEFSWDNVRAVSAVRIVSGWYRSDIGSPSDCIYSFSLQFYDGTGWQDVPKMNVEKNWNCDFSREFPVIRTDKLRLNITSTPGNTARIWEVEFYNIK